MCLVEAVLKKADEVIQQNPRYRESLHCSIEFITDNTLTFIPQRFNEKIIRLSDLQTLLKVLTLSGNPNTRHLNEQVLNYRKNMVITNVLHRIASRVLNSEPNSKYWLISGTAGLGIVFSATIRLY